MKSGASRIALHAAIAIAAVAGFAATNVPPDDCSAPFAAPRPASPERHYSLKLNTLYSPQFPVMGMFLKARIDGGPTLRLLLDSGATYIVLDKRAAAVSGRTAGSPFDLVSFGSIPYAARRTAPGTVEIGDLTLRDCNILAVDSKLLDGIDGVIPMSLFAGFLIHFDVPGKTLELEPYPQESPVQDGTYSAARADNCLLYLPAVLNETRSGYVLLDTGATYNAVSETAARAWNERSLLSHSIPLHGGAGAIDGLLLSHAVRFRFGSRVVSADPVVVVDLSDVGRHRQFEVAGILGYPALRRAIVTIDYRDSLVRIDNK
jgi:hypothetical protein